MASLIGINTRTGGIKQIPSRVGLYTNGVGLGPGEQHPDTITIVRDTRVFPDGESPPDWRTYDGSNWAAFGAYWYSERTVDGGNLKSAWYQNPADYYQITNEQGGGEGADVAGNYEQLVKVERAIVQAANADGRKCCILNLAGGSPGDFELWKDICAPFIVEAWETGGNVYGRHAYGQADKDANGNDIPNTGNFILPDGTIKPGQPQRVIQELEYLKSIGYGGGVVLTECGLDGGYGVVDYGRFEFQVTRWEQALRPYADMLIGLCWWELGASEFKADYTNHLKQLLPYIQAGDLPRWAPSTEQPPDGGEEPVTLKKVDREATAKKGDATHVRFSFFRREPQSGGTTLETWVENSEPIAIPEGANEIAIVQFEEVPDEPSDPNPPPVVFNPLPQGAAFADVSANNKLVNLATLKAQGVQGVGIRLSNGIRKNTDTTDENGVDIRAQHYIEEAESLDMPWLGYHFSNENYDDVEQVRHFLGIANQFIAAGHIPEMGLWLDFETPKLPVQGSPTTEPRIQLQLTTLANERPSFIGDYGPYTSAGWWNVKVPNAATWVPPLGLKSWVAAWVPVTTLVNGWPPSWWKPFPLKGFTDVHFWQWTSAGGLLVGHSVASLDLNFVGNTAVVPGTQPPPPPPPTGKTVDFSPYLMPASGNIGPFLVFEKAAGGTIDHQVQVKNGIVYVVKRAAVGTEYEELRISNGFIERRYDTSPADGLPYKLDDGYGWSKWMPVSMTEGQYYKRAPRVTKYDVGNNCQLVADQGVSESYIYFAKYHESYTLPGGVVKTAVCELHWLWAPGGTVLEKYFVAPGLWYIQWGNGEALHYLNEEPQGREPLPLSPVACLT